LAEKVLQARAVRREAAEHSRDSSRPAAHASFPQALSASKSAG
jgi:hypothetical protein